MAIASAVNAGTATSDAIVASSVRVRRGRTDALRGVSFTVPAGRVVGLFGPSGCGKTTLMRAIVGVQRNVVGELSVLGLPAGTTELRGRVGYLTQLPALYDELTVRECLGYFGALSDAPRARLSTVLDAVALTDCAERRIDGLSGGQRARASLAVALVGDPELLVLDEPTVGLDPLLRRDLWTLFRAQADNGRTLLVSSHVMDEARHCDELLLLRDGLLLWSGSPDAMATGTGTGDLDLGFIRLIESPASDDEQ